jgi:very-short-patch-repair endonuclease
MIRRNNLPQLKPRRRQLRNNPTPTEKLLWLYLKNSQLDGRKFRRQPTYGPYYLDFYCPAERLCVELDGESHKSQKAQRHDREKDRYLERHGIKVLRFTDEEVYTSVEKVLEKIRKKWRGRGG